MFRRWVPAYHLRVPANESLPPWHVNRQERSADRVALLLPGLGYAVERPLLHYTRAVFARHGWTTQEIRWPETPPPRDGDELSPWFVRLRSFVHAQVSPILDREAAPRIAVVGKSLGAFAAGLAADRGLPGVWLTPVLRDSGLADDLRRSSAPFLLVGSVADPSWDSADAHGLGRPVFEAQDADHNMETADDPARSADLLRQITVAVDAFVRKL